MKIKNIRVNDDIKEKINDDYVIEKNKGHKLLSTVGKIVLIPILLFVLSGCNRAIIDTKYGQNAALISGDDSAIILDIKDWKDYEGEQYQICATNGLVMLTASFDTDLYFGNSQTHSVQKFAKYLISEKGEIHDYYRNSSNLFNYELLDYHWNYNKATLFNRNKALVLNLRNWRDYEGEQLQVVTDEEVALLLSSYNSKLFYDKQSNMKAEDFAKKYVGSDGRVTVHGKESDNDSFSNYNIIDLNWNYNKAIIFKDNVAVILPITQWKDYEGEQLQLKITDGPTIVSAAYDTILINDSKLTASKRKEFGATAIANAIADRVIDLTLGKPLSEGFFNKQLLDFDYGFNNGIISTSNSATTFSISKWKDYEGEQLQVILPNGDAMLTSSIFLDMINDGTKDLNANTLAEYYGEKNILKATNLYNHVGFNKQILDFNYSFNYALHVENGNVTIIPLSRWKDYYNHNGHTSTHKHENPDGTSHRVVTTSESSPNCEQLQLELPDGKTALLTSAYDTILVNTQNVKQYAEWFRGKDGVITDLTSKFGKPTVSGWNWKLFDTTWNYNYGIHNGGINSQLFKVSRWMDFADGEQVQVYFTDDGGMVSSYCNLTLVSTDEKRKAEVIAEAFAGVSAEKGMVYKYFK